MNTRECLFNILEPPAFLKKHVANSLHMLGLSTLYLCVCQCVYVSVDSGWDQLKRYMIWWAVGPVMIYRGVLFAHGRIYKCVPRGLSRSKNNSHNEEKTRSFRWWTYSIDSSLCTYTVENTTSKWMLAIKRENWGKKGRCARRRWTGSGENGGEWREPTKWWMSVIVIFIKCCHAHQSVRFCNNLNISVKC